MAKGNYESEREAQRRRDDALRESWEQDRRREEAYREQERDAQRRRDEDLRRAWDAQQS